MGDKSEIEEELVQLARLSLLGKPQDVRLYIARLTRKYKQSNKVLSDTLNGFLKRGTESRSGLLRNNSQEIANELNFNNGAIIPACLTPVDLSIPQSKPILPHQLEEELVLLLEERTEINKLQSVGLRPSSSAFFIGKPGVGKTITAKWIASQLELPLYILDLASVMGSYLGQTGQNIKNAIEFAKTTPCVLLLDEIDALVKTRSDDSDIGEIKRVVTVMLQEIENWSPDSLLIAATNNPELIDHALWRRFDLVFEFKIPDKELVSKAIQVFLESDYPKFEKYIDAMEVMFSGSSYSDIQRTIGKFRRMLALGNYSPAEIISHTYNLSDANKRSRVEFAKALISTNEFSQHFVNQITGVSRDTLRKYKTLQTDD